MKNAEPAALLLVDIGTLFTHVAYVESVLGEYRLVARTQTLSTLELPDSDPWIGILKAVRELEQITARSLTRDDAPIMPHMPDGSGIDAMIVVTSAAGTLPLVTAAIANDTTGSSLRRVAHASYTAILDMVTLDERGAPQLEDDESWIDYQLANLATLPAATILLAGGVDGGNVAPLERMAHMLAFTVLRREQQASREFAHVIFAGNQNALSAVEDALANTASMTQTANVRPNLRDEVLMPARLELARWYTDRVLPKLPGYNRLRAMSSAPLHATSDGYWALTRFIAQHHQRHVLLLDLGSMTTAAYASDGTRLTMAVMTNCGTAYGAAGVLHRAGTQNIKAWLPFDITEQQLREHILNKMLRPQIVPISREDVQIEQAIAREALRLTLEQLNDEQPTIPYDLVIASGGVLTNVAHPAESLLMLLDVLNLASDQSLLTDIYLDREGVLALSGGAAWTHPDVAFCLLEQDVIRDGALASCLTIRGTGKAGDLAVEAEITPVGGSPRTLRVMHGEIRRLPLGFGGRATLRLKPAKNVRIGANEVGAEVQSDVAAIQGSLLGVVIDARSTVATNDDQSVRQTVWLNQLRETDQAGVQPLHVPMQPVAMEPEQELSEASAPPTTTDVPAWLQSDLQEEGLMQPAPETLGVETVPDWLREDDTSQADTVLDLGERRQQTDISQDISALRSGMDEKPAKKGFFRRR
ncbi:MAG: glutamate mutase L [Herpetosiphon sp.]|nr:glutamate mutase L [Herpetosiphon sp.]